MSNATHSLGRVIVALLFLQCGSQIVYSVWAIWTDYIDWNWTSHARGVCVCMCVCMCVCVCVWSHDLKEGLGWE